MEGDVVNYVHQNVTKKTYSMDKTIYFYINHLYYLFNQREIPNIIKA